MIIITITALLRLWLWLWLLWLRFRFLVPGSGVHHSGLAAGFVSYLALLYLFADMLPRFLASFLSIAVVIVILVNVGKKEKRWMYGHGMISSSLSSYFLLLVLFYVANN